MYYSYRLRTPQVIDEESHPDHVDHRNESCDRSKLGQWHASQNLIEFDSRVISDNLHDLLWCICKNI